MNPMTLRDPPPAVADPLVPYVDAVNRYLGLSRSTAERMLKRGDVSVVQLGRRVLVKHSELNRLIAMAEKRTLASRRRAAA